MVGRAVELIYFIAVVGAVIGGWSVPFCTLLQVLFGRVNSDGRWLLVGTVPLYILYVNDWDPND